MYNWTELGHVPQERIPRKGIGMTLKQVTLTMGSESSSSEASKNLKK